MSDEWTWEDRQDTLDYRQWKAEQDWERASAGTKGEYDGHGTVIGFDQEDNLHGRDSLVGSGSGNRGSVDAGLLEAVKLAYRNVDIVISQVAPSDYLVSWKFPGEDDVIHIHRPSESQALGYAKKQIDQFFDGYIMPVVVWRKGEDWWSDIEVENGVVPSDAVPYELDDLGEL